MSDYSLTISQLESALAELLNERSRKIENGFLMLKANYRSPGMKITATRIANAANYASYSTGNEQYGAFAHSICDLLNYTPDETRDDGGPVWTYAICSASDEKDIHGHFQWILRPQVAAAMENLGMVRQTEFPDALEDIEDRDSDLEALQEKERQAVVKARIGQGEFRDTLIRNWDGCSVTGCDVLDLLVASHIKPWRDCTPVEALDMPNGLLLLPNLDKAFDKGYVSFDDNGKIKISPQLTPEDSQVLGISPDMNLRKIYPQHCEYLAYHREHVFRDTI